MTDQELIAVIMPTGSIQLEWNTSSEATNKSSRLLQHEIHQLFVTDREKWLLRLGFCDRETRLSSSLDFWRRFAGEFVHKLIQTPDLETLRDRVQISIEVEELAGFIDTAPLMTGSEYLSQWMLQDVWAELNSAFSLAIQTFEGSVASFVKTYSPNIHLVGRVYFHLVENKNADVPFAFLATYTT
ncbi:ATP-dependent helicase, partial [bacterium]|nr:ATP-dependent helicase [bacterium]